MRTPKAPAGFVVVDSEEARKIDGKHFVNVVFVSGRVWFTSHNATMDVVRNMHNAIPSMHYHVQLPPAVEWEEVWGYSYSGRTHLTKNGNGLSLDALSAHELNTIVRALNEMEGRYE